MARPTRFSPEARERAVRMVLEHAQEHASQWAAITSIAEKIGCLAETLRSWVRQAERDGGRRPGLTTDARTRALHAYALTSTTPDFLDTRGEGSDLGDCVFIGHATNTGRVGRSRRLMAESLDETLTDDPARLDESLIGGRIDDR